MVPLESIPSRSLAKFLRSTRRSHTYDAACVFAATLTWPTTASSIGIAYSIRFRPTCADRYWEGPDVLFPALCTHAVDEFGTPVS